MRRTFGVALAIFAALGLTTPGATQGPPRLRLVTDVSAAGMAGDQWLAILRSRLSDSAYRGIAGLAHPLDRRERQWAELIGERLPSWESELIGLAATYAPAQPPATALIVLGNRGGADAFVHGRTTIGFDLSALHASYGDPREPENRARIDRFFRHEYTHLLQKAWLDLHPAASETPLDLALMDIWAEGLGNYHSLSSRWRRADGSLTDEARSTLAVLEPRFLARLAALACARPETAASLSAGLSAGRFTEKWGALPAALWLAAAEADSTGALRRMVLSGPSGVWALADRQMAPALRPVLGEIRLAASPCQRPPQR